MRSRDGQAHRLQFVGRQWVPLAALSATAFGAGAARWAAAGMAVAGEPEEFVVRITEPLPLLQRAEARVRALVRS